MPLPNSISNIKPTTEGKLIISCQNQDEVKIEGITRNCMSENYKVKHIGNKETEN